MITRSQPEKALRLLSLHTSGEMLVLPNVWDPIGARILEKMAYSAVATASAAVAASLGYQDGQMIRRTTLIDLIGRIARSVQVPVTADIEAGYGNTLSELEETVHLVIESGVVGVNIEDSLKDDGVLRPIDEQCQRICKLRQVADSREVHLVINARVDSFLLSAYTRQQSVQEAVDRARAYTAAGADCI
jgi:2-methylisocitrate lyase-like PEP mutase family enzyme